MDLVAPNLAALIGEIIGARLISHAGGRRCGTLTSNSKVSSMYIDVYCILASVGWMNLQEDSEVPSVWVRGF